MADCAVNKADLVARCGIGIEADITVFGTVNSARGCCERYGIETQTFSLCVSADSVSHKSCDLDTGFLRCVGNVGREDTVERRAHQDLPSDLLVFFEAVLGGVFNAHTVQQGVIVKEFARAVVQQIKTNWTRSAVNAVTLRGVKTGKRVVLYSQSVLSVV